MRHEILLVTPELAKDFLSRNSRNRPLSEFNVAFFEAQLKNNEMQLTHQGIAISSLGRLLDGQHRLTAIVRTGIAASLLVAFDVPEQVFSVLDTGSRRTAADVLAIDGAKYSAAIAAGIRLFLIANAFPNYATWKTHSAHPFATNCKIKAEYERDRDSWDWAGFVAVKHKLPRVVIPGPIAFLAYKATREQGFSEQYFDQFCAYLKDGHGLAQGNPILAYRNRVLLAGDMRQTSQERLADYIKLFNCYAMGQPLKVFKTAAFPPFPTVIHASRAQHVFSAA